MHDLAWAHYNHDKKDLHFLTIKDECKYLLIEIKP